MSGSSRTRCVAWQFSPPPRPSVPSISPPQVREGYAPGSSGPGSAQREVRPLRDVEREAISLAMAELKGHRGKIAEALGISRSTLYLKLREMGFK